MANQSGRTSTALARGTNAFKTLVVSSAVTELKSLGARLGASGGGVLVDAYVSAVTSVLTRVERFEDLNAERRFRRRPHSRSNESSPSAK